MYKSEGTVFKINKGNQNMKKKNHTADENFSLYRKQFSLIFLVIKKNHINRRKQIDFNQNTSFQSINHAILKHQTSPITRPRYISSRGNAKIRSNTRERRSVSQLVGRKVIFRRKYWRWAGMRAGLKVRAAGKGQIERERDGCYKKESFIGTSSPQ